MAGLDKPLVGRGYRITKTYLKVILDNPESRRIFQFLCLNFTYMFVQLLYGVYTNSLGLISDAIHMAFDNLAIAIGLFASIMATWKPDSDFTYGYGRVETLSGFANGVLLVLISLFIIFESIERIINPPEMEVSQLMVVSIGGLLVNLFGMFAMGGHHHHHHGHSHCSHSHSHGHAHDHKHSPIAVEKAHAHDSPRTSHENDKSKILKASAVLSRGEKLDERKTLDVGGLFGSLGSADDDDEHSHHDHLHNHSQNHIRSHDHGHSREHSHDHSHSRSNSHSHDHGHTEESHAHHHPHPHSHSHSHSDSQHSHNMRGVFLHVLADTMGSVGVVISTLMIQYWGWTGFDPIASLLIAGLIIASVVPLVIDCAKILSLDVGEANEANIKKTLIELLNIEGLDSYDNARFWPQDDSSLMGVIHIRISSHNNSFDHAHRQTKKHSSVDKVVEKVEWKLMSGIPGLKDVAIQVEPSL